MTKLFLGLFLLFYHWMEKMIGKGYENATGDNDFPVTTPVENDGDDGATILPASK